MGFHRYLDTCSVFKVEAWGLLEGLVLAAEMGASCLEVECDSIVLVNAVRRGTSISDIHSLLMEILQRLCSFQRWSIAHQWREDNICADFLANRGCEVHDVVGVHRLEVSLANMNFLLLHDRLGVGGSRSFRPP